VVVTVAEVAAGSIVAVGWERSAVVGAADCVAAGVVVARSMVRATVVGAAVVAGGTTARPVASPALVLAVVGSEAPTSAVRGAGSARTATLDAVVPWSSVGATGGVALAGGPDGGTVGALAVVVEDGRVVRGSVAPESGVAAGGATVTVDTAAVAVDAGVVAVVIGRRIGGAPLWSGFWLWVQPLSGPKRGAGGGGSVFSAASAPATDWLRRPLRASVSRSLATSGGSADCFRAGPADADADAAAADRVDRVAGAAGGVAENSACRRVTIAPGVVFRPATVVRRRRTVSGSPRGVSSTGRGRARRRTRRASSASRGPPAAP
jgi:hypothetical protein